MAPRAVLALTATASRAIQSDICSHLFIDPANGLLALSAQRDNLRLSSQVSSNENDKRAAILRLVRSPQIPNAADTDQQLLSAAGVRRGPSKPLSPLTIVYVWRRDEADSLGEYLKANGVSTVIYHAGALLRVVCINDWFPLTRCVLMQAWTRRRATRPKSSSTAPLCGAWWPRWPSAWAWTRPTCAKSCTTPCPRVSRTTCR